ncbi:methyltransferase family protein [Brevundimonas halotolerans]|uniref:Protein-S-isoprenylcysteine O-methyltransferase Ste14 n=1 Tax=Brevundimonas halotolerans TaxID=69670 RepID=A0A7W9A2H7_9CAUL|nr:isoprenylcysteine carboxylmethyltransferase family protein [Brevundimonas halotolerans]MBB5660194.1 protein-S-isoprenylcysteine O-methyltransferase Ste14 [Brevundimonas halotolerans]
MTTRDHPNVAVPPPLIYFAFLGLGWALDRYGVQIGLPSGEDISLGLGTELRRGLALALILGGLLLDGMAAGLFRRLGTAVEPWKPSTALATDGPYRFSRNPIYVGFALTYAGLAIAMDSPIALLMLIPCLVVIDWAIIRKEEAYLARTFGAEYEAYRNRVRRWL